ncbi:MAG TPA: hypothetical protein VK977_00640 [Actinomycetota bacterium]|nr:hypothetical protein [Actinomycetota bacterium]
MASVRCPNCADEIVPLPVERDEEPTHYVCPSCRARLTLDVVDQYLALEEEEASG